MVARELNSRINSLAKIAPISVPTISPTNMSPRKCFPTNTLLNPTSIAHSGSMIFHAFLSSKMDEATANPMALAA